MDRGVIILAGGGAARLGGQRKCWIHVNGEPNLSRTLRLLAPQLESAELQIVQKVPASSAGLISVPPEATIGESIRAAAERSTRKSWLVLLGDVVWDPSELQRALTLEPGEVLYHGTNLHTGKLHPEHLATAVQANQLLDVSTVSAFRELMGRAYFWCVDFKGWSDDLDTLQDLEQRLPVLERLAREGER